MEERYDSLEELFRKSLKNYSGHGVRPWNEEKKILDAWKKRTLSRRQDYWLYLLSGILLIAVLLYVVLHQKVNRATTYANDMKISGKGVQANRIERTETIASEPVPMGANKIANMQKAKKRNLKKRSE
ncbi:hypothetical protein GCM10023091_14310 [Ravibacter arvi]|uniref:Nitrogen regulatory IIA protein n=1 Tax=Ravibacter arvi TaxID=2051041 RepID=A0ABP8LUR5_9BACT